MRRSLRLALLAICSLTAVMATSGEAVAKPNRTSGDTPGGVVTVNAGDARVFSGSGGGGGGGPRCTWTPASVGEIIDFGGEGPNLGPSLSPEERAEQSNVTGRDGVERSAFFVKCPNQPTTLEMIDTSITVSNLAELTYQDATRIIPLPTHYMNPRPEDGSFVNLGLWLAVEEQTVQPITAEAANVWITAYPELTSASFDFGNGDGDDEVCGGLGEPYEYGSNVIEHGPCGYTYVQPGSYTVTITTTWTIPYMSSSGAGTIEPAIQTETTHEYQVNEIQTVGSGR